MNASLLLSLALAVLALRSFQVRHRQAGWEAVWRRRWGLFTVEVLRHAELTRLGGDSLEFPLPREFRVLALRLGALPLWSQQEIVGLPAQVDARIAEVTVREFDHLFERRFRSDGRRHSLRMATRPH